MEILVVLSKMEQSTCLVQPPQKKNTPRNLRQISPNLFFNERNPVFVGLGPCASPMAIAPRPGLRFWVWRSFGSVLKGVSSDEPLWGVILKRADFGWVATQRFLEFSSRTLGKLIQFDEHIFLDGLVQPPTNDFWFNFQPFQIAIFGEDGTPFD